MGAHARCEHAVPMIEGLLPERNAWQRTALTVLIAAPHVVDQHVEPSLLRANLLEQGLNVAIDGVIAPHRDAAATSCRDLPGTIIHGARHVVCGEAAADTATGDVDRGSRLAELEGNASSRAAAGAGDEDDCVLE